MATGGSVLYEAEGESSLKSLQIMTKLYCVSYWTNTNEVNSKLVVAATEKDLRYWMARHLGTFRLASSQLTRYASICGVSETTQFLGASKACYFNTVYN